MHTTSDFLGTRDVSKLFDRSEATIRWWVRTGKLSAIRLPSGQHVFRRGDVERLRADYDSSRATAAGGL